MPCTGLVEKNFHSLPWILMCEISAAASLEVAVPGLWVASVPGRADLVALVVTSVGASAAMVGWQLWQEGLEQP